MVLAAAAVSLLTIAGQPAAPPLDTLVDAGGYRMHVVVYRGTKPVTVVMEVGGGASLKGWAGVEALVAARSGATVVVYDRAGFGQSDIGPMDLAPRRQVEQLDRVLTLLQTPPDRILIGHSYGGLMAVAHAHLYPDKVRGLVLVDPMNPRFVTATGDAVYSTVPKIEHPTTARDSAVARLVSTFDGLVRDPTVSDADLTIPIVVITAGVPFWGKTPDLDGPWRASHMAIAEARPGRRLIVAEGSAHDIPAKRPDTIVDAATSLIEGKSAQRAPGAATSSDSLAQVRRELEARYAENEAGFFARDVDRVMRLRHPAFHTITPDGTVSTRDQMYERTRAFIARIERFDSLTETITALSLAADTAHAVVLQRTVRQQRLPDGQLHEVRTWVVQRESWIRTAQGWLFWRVDEIQPGVTLLDGRMVP